MVRSAFQNWAARGWAPCLLGLAACSQPDPCEGAVGACVSVRLEAVGDMRADRLRVRTRVNATQLPERTTTPKDGQAMTGFPLLFGVVLGDVFGDVNIAVQAELGGQTQGAGTGATHVDAMGRQSLTITLEGGGVDMAAPADQADAASAFPRSLQLSEGGYLDFGNGAPALSNLGSAGQLTLEAWVRPNPNLSRCGTIVSKNYNNGYWLGVCQVGGTWRLRFYSGGTASVDSNGALTPGVWSHVAATWTSGGAYTLFINGQGDATGPAKPAPTATTEPLLIGANPNTSGVSDFFFGGSLAEVRLWSTARTTAAIQGAMNTPLPGGTPGLAAVMHLNSDFNGLLGVGAVAGTAKGTPVPTSPPAGPAVAQGK